MEKDTLFPPILADPCSETVFSIPVGDPWGFLSGTNGFEDQQKAQFFSFDPEFALEINSVDVFFAVASPVGDGDVFVQIYSVGPDGGPADLLGTSQAVAVSEIVLPGEFVEPTTFVFDEPVQAPADNQFFASVDISRLYASRDTVDIFTTDFDCGNPGETWELWEDGSWFSYSDTLSWDIESNLLISTEVTVSDITSINERQQIEGFSLEPVFPNPASAQMRLSFALDQADEIQVEIFSWDGRRVLQQNLGQIFAGKHVRDIDVADLPSGMYALVLTSRQGRLTTGFSKQ
jgi:hypothetical protein